MVTRTPEKTNGNGSQTIYDFTHDWIRIVDMDAEPVSTHTEAPPTVPLIAPQMIGWHTWVGIVPFVLG